MVYGRPLNDNVPLTHLMDELYSTPLRKAKHVDWVFDSRLLTDFTVAFRDVYRCLSIRPSVGNDSPIQKFAVGSKLLLCAGWRCRSGQFSHLSLCSSVNTSASESGGINREALYILLHCTV